LVLSMAQIENPRQVLWHLMPGVFPQIHICY
jgi:hypothetical protein